MCMQMSLPSELIHHIIGYLAYTPRLPHSYSQSQFQCASPELLAFSVANWRLRRISLPFLFANIEIRHTKDAENFGDLLAVLFQKFTKILAISYFYSRTKEGTQIVCQLLPHLKQLSCVELRCCNARSVLFKAILAHPTVLSVLVEEQPDASLYDDLSKVVLAETSISTTSSPNLDECLNLGMRLGCLELLNLDLLDDNFGQRHFAGLEELILKMRASHLSFSWLSALSSANPALKEVWLLDDALCYFPNHTPTFISSFVEESQHQDLSKTFSVQRVGLGRTTVQCSQDWHVIGLTIFSTSAGTSLVELLTLIASSFPKLKTLTLDLYLHADTYDAHDLADVLARFSSLRVLFLHHIFKRLRFGSRRCVTPLRYANRTSPLDTLAARAESGLVWFTSRVAKRVLSLDTIFINDMGRKYKKHGRGSHWYLEGWLQVLNDRDVDGVLQRCMDGILYSDIRLATSMLSHGCEIGSFAS
ncbi:hypothetical protein DFJ43DRAFT_1107553 [Lentinula guzmanii]|uniref:Uncharacterized protein n=1 Tax=Lentinula guzmanii TaxID=2804957 RepID=A0AA38MVB3_9AGAR|nr:hypothetical protein DFJ43DRAFT_1107553 [Lentinula guzmanii]